MNNSPGSNLRCSKNIVLEGLDCTGKSTIAGLCSGAGYHVIHSPYNPHHKNMYQHYRTLIQDATTPVVFDRSFIAEMVYGPITRGTSRLSQQEFEALLSYLAERNFVILHLCEKTDVLRDRLQKTLDEHTHILAHLSDLITAYDTCMRIVSRFVPSYTLCPTELPQEGLIEYIIHLID